MHHDATPGKPMQKGFNESFNRTSAIGPAYTGLKGIVG
jgi:hypothetical protein